jgi:hypothetical protein
VSTPAAKRADEAFKGAAGGTAGSVKAPFKRKGDIDSADETVPTPLDEPAPNVPARSSESCDTDGLRQGVWRTVGQGNRRAFEPVGLSNRVVKECDMDAEGANHTGQHRFGVLGRLRLQVGRFFGGR